MDFVVGLPHTLAGYDAIWVIVDRLTESAHLLAIHNNFFLNRLAELYVNEILKLHGVLVTIVSDRDPRFTSRFWPKLQKALGISLHFSTTFHPQIDGQSERTIQTLEDMLRACILELRYLHPTFFEVQPMDIVDQEIKELRNKAIPMVKVL